MKKHMDHYNKKRIQIINLCEGYELSFIISAIIAFAASNDSWEAWDILRTVVIKKDEKSLTNISELVQLFLRNPQKNLDKYNDSGEDIFCLIKEVVSYWENNEFSFDIPTRELAAELIRDIIETKYDVSTELFYLMSTLNPIKMCKVDMPI